MIPLQFLIRLAAFSGFTAIVVRLVQMYWLPIPSNIWFGLLFFVLLNTVIYLLSVRSLRMNTKNSMTIILSAMMFRMMMTLIYVIIYWFSVAKDFYFLGSFLFLYVLFTIFEIYHLVTNLRPDSKQ